MSSSRRQFLSSAAAAAAAAAGSAGAQTRRRPNILFVMVDEMRWDAMSCAGHPVCRTPNLDRLAKQGTLFSNSYTVAPVCSPARASVFTGRYAQVHGVTTNQVPANDGEIFLPSILRHYGYRTCIAGKLHYVPVRYSFGFDEFYSFTSEGPTPELGYNAFLKKKHGSPAKFPRRPGTQPWPDDPLGRDVGVFRYGAEDFETEWITDRSIDFLRARAKDEQDKPWFLFTSYLKPHSPSVEPEKYFRMYDPDAMPVPKLPEGVAQMRASLDREAQRHWVADERMMRVMSAIYYGSITHIDEQVGRLFGELERLGMADNTIVLFTADHGNMLGDRGRWFKGVMWEGSSHVPLIWKGTKGSPENNGKVVHQIVENTDLLPTLLETAGLPAPPAGVQGRSFARLMRQGDPAWKDRAFAQLSSAMVRTPQYKLIDLSQNAGGEFELYDMRNDPKEQRNLIADPKQRDLVRHLKDNLTAWRAEKPPAVKIAGMATPDYITIPESERGQLRRGAPEGDGDPLQLRRSGVGPQ